MSFLVTLLIILLTASSAVRPIFSGQVVLETCGVTVLSSRKFLPQPYPLRAPSEPFQPEHSLVLWFSSLCWQHWPVCLDSGPVRRVLCAHLCGWVWIPWEWGWMDAGRAPSSQEEVPLPNRSLEQIKAMRLGHHSWSLEQSTQVLGAQSGKPPACAKGLPKWGLPIKLHCSLLTTTANKSRGLSQPPQSFIIAVTAVMSRTWAQLIWPAIQVSGGLSSDGVMIGKLCVWSGISSVLSQWMCWY